MLTGIAWCVITYLGVILLAWISSNIIDDITNSKF